MGANPYVHQSREGSGLFGKTIFHLAALSNDIALVKSLLEQDHNFTCFDFQGRTPYHCIRWDDLTRQPTADDLAVTDMGKALESGGQFKALQDASAYYNFEESYDFASDELQRTADKQSTPALSTVRELLDTSFIVGETHTSVSARQFLVDNAVMLKENQFDVIFMEHLPYRYQPMLDEYLKTKQAPLQLSAYLRSLDEKFRQDPEASNSFSGLVKNMIEADVRVVGVEHQESYLADRPYQIGEKHPDERFIRFNAFSASIIERELVNHPGAKWTALMGHAHLNEYLDGVAGVCERLSTEQAPIRTVYTFEALNTGPECVITRQPLTVEEYEFQPDLLLNVAEGAADLSLDALEQRRALEKQQPPDSPNVRKLKEVAQHLIRELFNDFISSNTYRSPGHNFLITVTSCTDYSQIKGAVDSVFEAKVPEKIDSFVQVIANNDTAEDALRAYQALLLDSYQQSPSGKI